MERCDVANNSPGGKVRRTLRDIGLFLRYLPPGNAQYPHEEGSVEVIISLQGFLDNITDIKAGSLSAGSLGIRCMPLPPPPSYNHAHLMTTMAKTEVGE